MQIYWAVQVPLRRGSRPGATGSLGAFARALRCRGPKIGSCGRAPQDSRRQRSVMASAHCRRPARTFVLPAPRVQDGLTISPSPFRKQTDSKAPTDHIPDNGQVERMDRTIKQATVKRYFYESHDQLRTHLRDFVSAYNFARRLKTLKGLTPYEFCL
jgi:Integrase core domain